MNTDRLLDVLSTQLAVIQASLEKPRSSDFYDEDDIGFDHDIVLNTPSAYLEDIVESSDVSQIYLTGVLDSVNRLNALPSTNNIHRKRALNILSTHRRELQAHLDRLDLLINTVNTKQKVSNVITLRTAHSKGDKIDVFRSVD